MTTPLRLDFPAIQTKLTTEEIETLAEAIKNANTLTMGPHLKTFESNFAEYLNIAHAFGVNNATAALELTAMIPGIYEGDEVILPAHTFTATALPFLRRKAKIIFADIVPDTFVMDVDDVKKKITPKTRAIVPVHLYGLPVEMDSLMKLARENNCIVIEDCAQSPGAAYKGKKTGSFGDFGVFSFHGQKNITTLGEGGMIVTNNDDYAKAVLGLRKIGARPFEKQEKYWLPAMSNIIEAVSGELPYNFALSEIQALAGNLILKRIDAINEKRRATKQKIETALSVHPELVFQNNPAECLSACHLLPARFDGKEFGKTRDDLIEILFNKYRIKSVVQYYPLYRYDLFIKNGYSDDGSCPNTNHFFDNMLSFPFGSDMRDEDVDYLIESIDKAINALKGN